MSSCAGWTTLLIAATLLCGTNCSSASAASFSALAPGGMLGDDRHSIIYNAGSGNLDVDVPPDTGLSSINIDSAAGIFAGVPSADYRCGGPDCEPTEHNIFKATFRGTFDSLEIGPIATPGLSETLLLNDLTVAGSMNALNSGPVSLENDRFDLIYIPVPEPNNAFLLATDGVLGDDRLSVVYDARIGEVSVESPVQLFSVLIESQAGIFTGDSPNVAGTFENVDPDHQLFQATFSGLLDAFDSWNFGTAAEAGLSKSFILSDLSVTAGTVDRQTLTVGDLIYIPIPEPSAMAILVAGLVAIFPIRNRASVSGGRDSVVGSHVDDFAFV